MSALGLGYLLAVEFRDLQLLFVGFGEVISLLYVMALVLTPSSQPRACDDRGLTTLRPGYKVLFHAFSMPELKSTFQACRAAPDALRPS